MYSWQWEETKKDSICLARFEEQGRGRGQVAQEGGMEGLPLLELRPSEEPHVVGDRHMHRSHGGEVPSEPGKRNLQFHVPLGGRLVQPLHPQV